MPTNPATPEQLERFRSDAQYLLDLYTNKKMARRLGIDPTNFSAYVSGSKPLSLKKIKQFYDAYGKDLEKYDRSVPETPVVEEQNDFYAVYSELEKINKQLAAIRQLLPDKDGEEPMASENNPL